MGFGQQAILEAIDSATSKNRKPKSSNFNFSTGKETTLGQYPTPAPIVNRMLDMLNVNDILKKNGCILDPGCGEGAFVLECVRRAIPIAQQRGLNASWIAERLTGIEIDSELARRCKEMVRYELESAGFTPTNYDLNKLVINADFLSYDVEKWDAIVANPPYVRIENLEESYRRFIKKKFKTAVNRFDLYFIFLEQSLRLLHGGGKLCFITPQKYMQVWSGVELRKLLSKNKPISIVLLREDTFQSLITYPAITLVSKGSPAPEDSLRIINERTNQTHIISLHRLDSNPWTMLLSNQSESGYLKNLGDVCSRIGVGIATGADKTFELTEEVASTIPIGHKKIMIGGRQLSNGEHALRGTCIAWPYDDNGHLLPKERISELITYLEQPLIRNRLKARSCIKKHPNKPWYAFHERPRPKELIKPKIMVQDIQKHPTFYLDLEGIVPKHSVYYIIPKEDIDINKLLTYLNSDYVTRWLLNNCQTAAGGRIRIQSETLKRLPVPDYVDL